MREIDAKGKSWTVDWYAIYIDLDSLGIKNPITETILEINEMPNKHELILGISDAVRLYKTLKEALKAQGMSETEEDLFGNKL